MAQEGADQLVALGIAGGGAMASSKRCRSGPSRRGRRLGDPEPISAGGLVGEELCAKKVSSPMVSISLGAFSNRFSPRYSAGTGASG